MADAPAVADAGTCTDLSGEAGNGDTRVSGGGVSADGRQPGQRHTGVLAGAELLRALAAYL